MVEKWVRIAYPSNPPNITSICGDLSADVLGRALGELSLSQFALLSVRLRLVLVVFIAKQLCLTVGQ